MEYKFVPSLCKGEAKKFEGHFIIDLPSYEQQLDMAIESSLDVSGGQVESAKSMSSGLGVMKKALKFVKGAEMKRLEDGYEYKSLQEVLICKAARELVNEALNAVIGGVELGKA